MHHARMLIHGLADCGMDQIRIPSAKVRRTERWKNLFFFSFSLERENNETKRTHKKEREYQFVFFFFFFFLSSFEGEKEKEFPVRVPENVKKSREEKICWPTWRDFGRGSFFHHVILFKWLNVLILTRRYRGVAGQEEEEGGGKISTSNNKYQQPVGKTTITQQQQQQSYIEKGGTFGFL